MSSSPVAPTSSDVERVRAFAGALPQTIFRTNPQAEQLAAWRISPRPFLLAPTTVARIEALGNDLLAFFHTLSSLYNRSARGTAPSFVAEYLDQGKPEAIVKLARQNRFKSDVPGVIRPDLILTEKGFIASELDSVPGGMGFVGAMTEAYAHINETTIGGRNGMARQFAAMLSSISAKPHPIVAVVVSQESEDYREELRWLAENTTKLGLAETYVCRPQDIVFSEEALFIRLPDGREEKIDVLYRNFELFDLQNIAKSELMLYAARHNRVKFTPPPRAPLEEKLGFALLHHARLRGYWSKELGPELYSRLLELFPQTWILDPRPLPPQASIANLEMSGEPIHDWMQLGALGKGDRDYVVKPSGFSELAWGSKGVRIANDLTKDAWESALRAGLDAFQTTPHILQRFHKGRRVRVPYLDERTNTIRDMEGRVRLCPYYFVVGQETRLGGILATIAPADKRLIHGMAEAIMAPCAVDPNGV